MSDVPSPTPPADGTYTSPARLSGASCTATFSRGRLTAFSHAGEVYPAERLTELCAAHVAHDLACLNAEGVKFAPPPPTITRNRARELHRFMSRVGIPAREHYATAAAVLGIEVRSLAELYPMEARQVWRSLRDTADAARDRDTAA